MTDAITKYYDFFDDAEVDYISNKSLEIINNPNSTYRTNYTSWRNEIIDDSSIVLVYDIVEENILEIVNRVCENKIGRKPTSQLMFYYWSNGGYIPWHNDAHVSNACTIYLNPEWNLEDGGLYQYIESDEIKTVFPKYNLCVLQNNHTLHATTPTKAGAPWRRSMQFFFKNQ